MFTSSSIPGVYLLDASSTQWLQPKMPRDTVNYALGDKMGLVEAAPSGLHFFPLIVEPPDAPQDQNGLG